MRWMNSMGEGRRRLKINLRKFSIAPLANLANIVNGIEA